MTGGWCQEADAQEAGPRETGPQEAGALLLYPGGFGL